MYFFDFELKSSF